MGSEVFCDTYHHINLALQHRIKHALNYLYGDYNDKLMIRMRHSHVNLLPACLLTPGPGRQARYYVICIALIPK